MFAVLEAGRFLCGDVLLDLLAQLLFPGPQLRVQVRVRPRPPPPGTGRPCKQSLSPMISLGPSPD